MLDFATVPLAALVTFVVGFTLLIESRRPGPPAAPAPAAPIASAP